MDVGNFQVHEELHCWNEAVPFFPLLVEQLFDGASGGADVALGDSVGAWVISGNKAMVDATVFCHSLH